MRIRSIVSDYNVVRLVFILFSGTNFLVLYRINRTIDIGILIDLVAVYYKACYLVALKQANGGNFVQDYTIIRIYAHIVDA